MHSDEIPGMYSFSSDKWKADAARALQEFCDEVDRLPFGERVIGYFLAAGGTSEWYPVNAICDRRKNKYGDFSPAFRKAYEDFLRRRYGTEEKLRKAWKRAACISRWATHPPGSLLLYTPGAARKSTFPLSRMVIVEVVVVLL